MDNKTQNRAEEIKDLKEFYDRLMALPAVDRAYITGAIMALSNSDQNKSIEKP